MDITGSLNPNAKPWEPTVEKGTAEDRTMFITFSMGHPLKQHHISDFFTRYTATVFQLSAQQFSGFTWPEV